MARDISRREFVGRASLLPLAAVLSSELWTALDPVTRAWASGPFVFFDEHQAAVVREATARLIPGPTDDPAELGHPGAREANVVAFIDVLLGAFGPSPPKIHAGGPWSDRPDPRQPNFMATFVPLAGIKEEAWRNRVTALQDTYREGIQVLDALAGGDFAAAPPPAQDAVLASNDATDFRDVLFTNAIEGMYSVPEYGGNAGLAGWRDIKFRGDTQPVGWAPSKVSQSDGLDPIAADLVPALTASFDDAMRVIAGRRR